MKAGANELLARMKAEKDAPQADLYLSVDAASLDRASKAGVLQKIESPELSSRLPNGFGPKNDAWLPITMRARVIVYAKDRVKTADAPKTYADLANPQWRGRIVLNFSEIFNQYSLEKHPDRSDTLSILHNSSAIPRPFFPSASLLAPSLLRHASTPIVFELP